MNRNILIVVGCLLMLVGILGFVTPTLFGMHLGYVHNAIHLISGALALYFGIKGTLSAARTFSIVFGLIYGALGLLGLIVGGTSGMWTVIPNQLVLGFADHIVHLVLSAVLLIAAWYKTSKYLPHAGHP